MSVVGRSTYGAAVDPQRSASTVSQGGPVLAAWGVVGDRPQFPSAPFPEMPPAAAAAVSPVVPGAPAAAAPPDPYGRCWQNHVDAGACFPYFGTLYGSSLPPPSYRMQPGCMSSNLGQFWPPTPPPDGCVRYDGANNLHFCSPLTPMFRHSESLPQTMLGVHHQRLGHYSHLIDVNKDAGLKRLDACIDNVQRQKMALPSKHSKDVVQQRLCHCYECNEKNTPSVTPSINKENISRSLDQRYIEEKFKSKSCKKSKDDNVVARTPSSNYHSNSSAITGYSCSVDQNAARTISTMQNLQTQDARSYQKQDLAVVTSSSGLQYEFAHPNSTSGSGIRCGSNSVFTVPSSNAISPVVSTTAKCSEQPRYENVEKAQQRRIPTASIPGFDSYTCPPVQTPACSHAHHPNDKSCCFSPPYISSRTLYPSHSENYAHSKTPNAFVIHGNNYNASPLKNVYFSYYESENVDLASDSSARRHSRNSLGKQEKVSNLGYINNRLSSEKPIDYLVTTAANGAHGINPSLSNSYPYRNQQKMASTPVSIHGPLQSSTFVEQHKTDTNFCNYLGTTSSRKHEKSAFSKHLGKTTSAFIKQEKVEAFDCKFQKSNVAANSAKLPQLPESSAASNEVLNLSTSLRCPKIEPNDTHYSELGNVIPETYNNTYTTSVAPSTVSGMTVPTVTCQSIEPSPHRTNDVTNSYSSNLQQFCGIDKTHGIQDATSLRMHENQCTPAVPEDLVSVGQVAPTVDELVILNKMPSTGSEAPVDVMPLPDASDAEKTENASQSLQESAPSLVAVQPMESADIGQYLLPHEKCENTATQQLKKNCSVDGCFASCNQACNECSLCQDKVGSSSKRIGDVPLSGDKSYGEDPKLADVAETINLVKIKAEELVSSISIESHCINVNDSQIMPELSVKGKNESEVVKTESVYESNCIESNEKDLALNDSFEIDISGKIKTEIDTSVTRPSEYHGLYLLLQGIDRQCNIDEKDVKEKILQDFPNISTPEPADKNDKDNTSKSHAASMKGLNLLCALVEDQFVKEFGDEKLCKIEEIKEDIKPFIHLKSNYPDVNKTPVSKSYTEENLFETQLTSDEDRTVLEMRKKLAELQQQYKEKQKELARLRPKKSIVPECSKKSPEPALCSKGPVSLDSSLTPPSGSTENSGLSLNSSISTCQSKENSTCSPEVVPKNATSVEESNSETPDIKVDSVNVTPVKSTAKVSTSAVSSNVSKCMEEEEEVVTPQSQCSSNNASASANLSVKIDISLGICKTSKRTVRRSFVKRKLELRSSKHTITVSESKATKLKSCRNSKSKRLKNSLLRATERNGADKSNDSSSLSDEAKLSATPPKKTEKKMKFSKKDAHRNANDSSACCPNKKSRLELISDCDIIVDDEAQALAKSPKKRKAENPKKFMPSKQVRLTETIVAKQLRNRILFESPDSVSEEKEVQKEYDVPEELFDALRKCHLGDSCQSLDKCSDVPDVPSVPSLSETHVDVSVASSNETHSKLRMTSESLIENQRILAVEDGLLYAGCIREIQNDDVYGIVLDGQRGNKKHIFSREEMFSLTILELKPKSVDELPEGTRVCAYWSHQYRCLYPGTVVKAPTPSADWSEPRVFVEFDDGDSAQIATKNIRFLPSDMQLSDEVDSEASMPNLIPAISTEDCAKDKTLGKGKRKKRGMVRTSRKHAKLSKKENSSSKTASCSNVHSFDMCSSNVFAPSPSHGLEGNMNGQDLIISPTRKGSKRTLNQSKRPTESRSKVKESSSTLDKNKKHKKYKDRHKHHHHHHRHRHHHRHCHRHRHCRKHKHHKRTAAVDEEQTSEIISVVIPSSASIPFGDIVAAKSTRSSTRDSETHCLGHSRKTKLPQAAKSALANGPKSLTPDATGEKPSSAKTEANACS